MTVPHLNVFILDTIRVVTSSNGTAEDKLVKAKAQMAAFSNRNVVS